MYAQHSLHFIRREEMKEVGKADGDEESKPGRKETYRRRNISYLSLSLSRFLILVYFLFGGVEVSWLSPPPAWIMSAVPLFLGDDDDGDGGRKTLFLLHRKQFSEGGLGVKRAFVVSYKINWVIL
jgi:hypothetical protein